MRKDARHVFQPNNDFDADSPDGICGTCGEPQRLHPAVTRAMKSLVWKKSALTHSLRFMLIAREQSLTFAITPFREDEFKLTVYASGGDDVTFADIFPSCQAAKNQAEKLRPR